MDINPKYLARHELIGLEVEVLSSKNSSLVGLKGTIMDETKNTLVLETEKGEKKLVKSHVSLKVNLKQGTFVLDGSKLTLRPEDRIKRVRK